MMEKIWKVWDTIPKAVSEQLAKLPPLTRQMLYRRGLAEPEQARQFLQAEYGGQTSPFLFQDMAKAVARIWQAVEAGEKITVYGDYDADAVTASAVLLRALRHLGAEADSYIPDRFTEGYGVNLQAIEKLALANTRLVITVDCGTNSCDAADLCKKLGMDFIITDHHEIIGDKPSALALINPKNSNDQYPYRELTGVGVAFRLAQALVSDDKAKKFAKDYVPGWEKWLLDLVAIGTVADCHSLLGENRVLVKYGLKVLAKTRWPGLRALSAAAGLDFAQKAPDTYTLGFVLAPRLNAAGRLEHAGVALDLLLEDDAVAAQQKAAALNEINQRRQNLTQVVLGEAREQALLQSHRPVLLLYKPGWPK
ncbi:MAG: DHH family phosphoesterase, partial [Patescibacteria group bacterium]|nr:DHH family phosphoesterase [Patescibacteria group bacterium]